MTCNMQNASSFLLRSFCIPLHANITNYLQGLLNRPNSGPRNVNDYDVMNASENILQTI